MLSQAVEKLVMSKLLVEGSNKRIFNIDHHVGMVSALTAHTQIGAYCACIPDQALP